jgi:hypothetical protein
VKKTRVSRKAGKALQILSAQSSGRSLSGFFFAFFSLKPLREKKRRVSRKAGKRY